MNETGIYTTIGVLVSAYLTYLATRGKIKIDASNTKIGGEKSAYEMSREFAQDMESRFAKLQERFDLLSEKFDTMKAEKAILASEVIEKDKRIATLETKVGELQTEVARYQEIKLETN